MRGAGQNAETERKPPVVYLAGPPNCGKSTLFSALTGRYAKVGNREGVTVDVKGANISLSTGPSTSRQIRLLDLPGIRRYPPMAPDEQLSMETLMHARREDRILWVVMADRLTEGLRWMDEVRRHSNPTTPWLLVINGCDDPSRCLRVASARPETLLGLPVLTVSALRRRGVEALRGRIQESLDSEAPEKIDCAEARCAACSECASWAHRLTQLEGLIPPPSPPARWRTVVDAWLTRPWPGVLCLLAVWTALLWLCFGAPGDFLSQGLEACLQAAARETTRMLAGAHPMLSSFVAEGLMGGLCSVLTFLPRLMLLYLGLACLEESGYLPRAARLAEPVMAKCGMSGAALIPLMLGMGCTVPAALTTRTLADAGDRRRCLTLLPLVMCSARMPLLSLMATAYFGGHTVLFCAAVYACSAVIAWAVARISFLCACRKTCRRAHGRYVDGRYVDGRQVASSGAESQAPSLPLLRIPTPGGVCSEMVRHVGQFLRRISGVLLLTSVAVWLLSHQVGWQGWAEEAGVECWLYRLGAWVTPLLRPLDLGHPAFASALLAGVGAKEAIVTVLGVCCAAPSGMSLAEALVCGGFLSLRGAVSLSVFASMYCPCTAALRALQGESRALGRRVMVFAVLRSVLVAYAAAWVIGWAVSSLAA